mmetsp:Transcript_13445/g.54280  ORF Transcript_13445/g.54280 Transcript_13445/m.54280 type:complete len:165 (+) Transcript_13445:371-865(+)
MAVRRDEESLRPSVMLFKPEEVLKMWQMGPELAAELDSQLATSILAASGEPESVFSTPRLDQADVETLAGEDAVPIADAFSLCERSLRGVARTRPALLQIRGGTARELKGAGMDRDRLSVVAVPGPAVDLRGLHWTIDEEQRGLDAISDLAQKVVTICLCDEGT